MTGWLWSILLLVVGLAVMVLEVFVPSGGVLGFVSFAALVAAVATAFAEQGTLAGFTVLGAAIVLVPSVLLAAFRWFPSTTLGRRVLPPPPDVADIVPHREAREAVRGLVGRRGIVVSELVPWGTVQVSGRVVEAMSEGGVIAGGTEVDVVGTEGTGVVVRRCEAGVERPAPGEVIPPPLENHEPTGSGGPEAVLNKTLEEFDFGEIGRPPA